MRSTFSHNAVFASIAGGRLARIESEEATFAAKERELQQKLEETHVAIGEETREASAEKGHWQQKAAELDAAVAALKQQLALKEAEVTQCAAQVVTTHVNTIRSMQGSTLLSLVRCVA